jgi:arylsulfatase
LFISDHGASAAELGIVDGPTGMPKHFDVALERSDNSLDNMGRRGSFVDRGRGFAEAATAPLRLFKGTLGEGGIRAPAFLHYPGIQQQAGINGTFFTAMDILPTFLDLAQTRHPGAAQYNGRQVQAIAGRSFWPHVMGKSQTVHGEDGAAGWSLRGRGALIKGGYKLTNQPRDGRRIEDFDALAWHLYDLTADPGETTDLAEQNPDLAAAMKAEWERDWQ